MGKTEKDLARIRLFLRHHIGEQGLTLRQVEQEIGWGKGYVGALLRGGKPLRVEQVHQILNAIGVTPEELWDDVYGYRRSAEADILEDLASVKASLGLVMEALKRASLIEASELEQATALARAPSR